MKEIREGLSADTLNQAGGDFLPGLVGVKFLEAGEGWISGELPVRQAVMAPDGFLHAASVVALADSACGYGCVRALPEGASGFTTIELKTNFLGTAREGVIECRGSVRVFV